MRLKLILATLTSLLVVPAIALTLPAQAVVQSSIEGGDIYRAKNVTKGTDFADPTSADACDVLQYMVRIHNGGPDETLNNVTVQASFPTGALTKNVSTAIVRADNASPSNTSDTATVNLSSAQTMSYVPGSTQLLDANGAPIKTLPDTITQGGVSIGSVGISLNEKRFVVFQEKVKCQETPPPAQPSYACTLLDVQAGEDRTAKITAFTTSQANGATFKNAVVSWGDSSADLTSSNLVGQTHQYAAAGSYTITATAHFDVNGVDKSATSQSCSKKVTFAKTPKTPPTVTPPTTITNVNNNSSPSSSTTVGGQGGGSVQSVGATPTTLVNTGPGTVVALFGAASAAGTVAYRWFLTRRLQS